MERVTMEQHKYLKNRLQKALQQKLNACPRPRDPRWKKRYEKRLRIWNRKVTRLETKYRDRVRAVEQMAQLAILFQDAKVALAAVRRFERTVF